MSTWPAAKARRVLAALLHIGWQIKRERSSHKTLARDGFADYVFAFHDGDEIGPRCSLALPATLVSPLRISELNA